MLHSKGLQLPKENTFLCLNNSIAYSTANVKYSEKWREQTAHIIKNQEQKKEVHEN